MSAILGQAIVVENHPGVNGMIGADVVAKANPDGYTILIGNNSTNAALKSLMKRLPYDQDKAFTPIGLIGSLPLVVTVNNEVPARNLKELIALAKKKPGELIFGSSSSSQLVSSSMLASMTGINLMNAPYKSGPSAMTDLTLPQIQAGKIRGLAVTSIKRSRALPNLPTINEALGIKHYELIAYFGIYAPAGTPRLVIDQLNNALNRVAQLKDIQEQLLSIGFETQSSTPEALGARDKVESIKWAKAIQEAGIQAQ